MCFGKIIIPSRPWQQAVSKTQSTSFLPIATFLSNFGRISKFSSSEIMFTMAQYSQFLCAFLGFLTNPFHFLMNLQVWRVSEITFCHGSSVLRFCDCSRPFLQIWSVSEITFYHGCSVIRFCDCSRLFLQPNSSEDRSDDITNTVQDQATAEAGAAKLNRFLMKTPWWGLYLQ